MCCIHLAAGAHAVLPQLLARGSIQTRELDRRRHAVQSSIHNDRVTLYLAAVTAVGFPRPGQAFHIAGVDCVSVEK